MQISQYLHNSFKTQGWFGCMYALDQIQHVQLYNQLFIIYICIHDIHMHDLHHLHDLHDPHDIHTCIIFTAYMIYIICTTCSICSIFIDRYSTQIDRWIDSRQIDRQVGRQIGIIKSQYPMSIDYFIYKYPMDISTKITTAQQPGSIRRQCDKPQPGGLAER